MSAEANSRGLLVHLFAHLILRLNGKEKGKKRVNGCSTADEPTKMTNGKLEEEKAMGGFADWLRVRFWAADPCLMDWRRPTAKKQSKGKNKNRWQKKKPSSAEVNEN